MTNQEFIESISLPNEEWRDVVGFEGLYLVSNMGRIISLPRRVRNHTGYRLSKIRILSPRLNSGGYYQVMLCVDGENFQPHIHKLVAEAFIDNPNGYPQVDHIDCDKLNNHISNLRWCTQAINNMNPISVERRRKSMPIVKTKVSKANSVPVVRIDPSNPKDIKIYPSQKSTSEDGFCPSHIASVCLGKTKYHKDYEWMYLSDYENLVSMSKN